MKLKTVTALQIAERFIGLKEAPGVSSNPSVLAMLQLDQKWPEGDDVPWCSAFVNYVAWLLDLPRSKSLAARSWLIVGKPIELVYAEPGFDVIVFKRGSGTQPGPNVIDAPGHVAFYVGRDASTVTVIGGNQGDAVTRAMFPTNTVLGVRRLN